MGIGDPPEGYEHLGCVSQMAVFIKITMDDNESDSIELSVESDTYKLLKTCVYDANRDERSRECKILDAAKYQISRLKNMEDDYYYFEEDVFKIPLKDIISFIFNEVEDVNELK